MTTFADLRDANIRRNKEWVPDEPLSITFRATELAGESGEACNAIKKIERERLGLKGSRATLEDLAEELADTVICCDLIAMDTGINLASAIERKFDASSEKNGLETRFAPKSSGSRKSRSPFTAVIKHEMESCRPVFPTTISMDFPKSLLMEMGALASADEVIVTSGGGRNHMDDFADAGIFTRSNASEGGFSYALTHLGKALWAAGRKTVEPKGMT